MASINNRTAVYADKFYLSSSTGVSEISDTYATKTEVGDAANSSNITANADVIDVLHIQSIQTTRTYTLDIRYCHPLRPKA